MANKIGYSWGIVSDVMGEDHAVGGSLCGHKHRTIWTAEECLDDYQSEHCSPGWWLADAGLFRSDGSPVDTDTWELYIYRIMPEEIGA